MKGINLGKFNGLLVGLREFTNKLTSYEDDMETEEIEIGQRQSVCSAGS